MKPKDFNFKFLPYATESAKRFGFADPLFLMAQQFAENSGDSTLLANTNNVGSLISRYNGKKLPVGLFWGGEDYFVKSTGIYFRVYKTLQDGYNDFAKLLAKQYNLNTAKSIEEYADKVSKSAYINIANGDNREQYAKNIVSTYYSLKNAL